MSTGRVTTSTVSSRTASKVAILGLPECHISRHMQFPSSMQTSWNENKLAKLDYHSWITLSILFFLRMLLVWHPHLQFFLVPVFTLTSQKKGHKGGSHLKVQPNVNNSGRDYPEQKPLLPHSFANIFHHLLFIFLFFCHGHVLLPAYFRLTGRAVSGDVV